MATCLDKWQNILLFHHRHVKRFHIVKFSTVCPEIFDKIRRTTTWTCNANSIHLFSSKTTGSIFTKILHDIVALMALFNLAHTRRYPIPFLNARATKVRSLPFFLENWLPWQRPLKYQKRGPYWSSTPKTLSFGVKTAKIGPADLEIICLREIIKKEKKKEIITDGKYTALPASLPSGLN